MANQIENQINEIAEIHDLQDKFFASIESMREHLKEIRDRRMFTEFGCGNIHEFYEEFGDPILATHPRIKSILDGSD